MNEPWKGDGTRRDSSGGLEELGRIRCRYVVGSVTDDFRGENTRDSVTVPIFKEKGASMIVGIIEASI